MKTRSAAALTHRQGSDVVSEPPEAVRNPGRAVGAVCSVNQVFLAVLASCFYIAQVVSAS